MLDTLDVRLAQAGAGEPATSSSSRRSARTSAPGATPPGSMRRVREARFEQTWRSRSTTSPTTPRSPPPRSATSATLRFVDAGESVIFRPRRRGQDDDRPGARAPACRRGYYAPFTKTSRLLADLAGGHVDRTFETRLAAGPAGRRGLR